jgi:hypothetical protein
MTVRNPLVQGLYRDAPYEVRDHNVREFRSLVRDGLSRDAARAIAASSPERWPMLAASLDAVDKRMIRKLEDDLVNLGLPTAQFSAR